MLFLCWCRATIAESCNPHVPLPVLLNIERPLELQMRLIVVIDELGDSLVVSSP